MSEESGRNSSSYKYSLADCDKAKEVHKMQIKQAEGIISIMSDYDKNQLTGLAERIAYNQRRLRLIFNRFTKEICPECSECCCYNSGGYNKVGDFVIYMLLDRIREMPKPRFLYAEKITYSEDEHGVIHTDVHQTRRCSFLSDRGCRMPSDLRSVTCWGHICSKLHNKFSKYPVAEQRVNNYKKNLNKLYDNFWKIMIKSQKLYKKNNPNYKILDEYGFRSW